ncbi:MAG: hypothetical protein Q4D20_08680 [Clostridia bacterium]|nr:hypothetical protein [Clostridia bacterium]
MICRNCSAEIDDRNEKCPHCHKDPKKRDSRSKGGIVAIILIILAVIAAVFIGLNFDEVKEKVFSVLPQSVVSALSKEGTTESTKEISEPSSKESQSSQNETEKKTTEKETSKKVTETKTEKKETTQKPANEKDAKEGSKTFDLLKAEIKEIPVLSSEKKEISKRGLITAEKEKLKALGSEKFGEFCLQKISRSPYSWVTIKFSDSTGIVFTGNCATFAVYCKLDKNDYIGEVLGTIILSSDGKYVFTSKSSPASAEPVTTSPAKAEKETTESKTTEKKTTEKKTTKAKTTTKQKETSADYTLNKNALKNKTTTKAPKETTAAKTTTKKAENSSVVYITDSGKKYHADGCPSLSKSKHEISLKDAKSKGYTACKRCKP